MNKYIVLIVISFLSIALWGSTIAGQGFDNTANDTWAYTASPASTVPYIWGSTNQNLGGATAQSGSWYWGSWLMEAGAASLTFTNVSITPALNIA